MIRWGALLLLLLAAGCVSSPSHPGPQGVLAKARGPEQNQNLYIDLVRKMIENDQLYAALAHLDAQKQEYGSEPAARLLRAEVLRKLGRSNQAAMMYKSLIEEGVFRGRAEHGLGLIKVGRNLGAGIRHLQTAAELRPTDARIRNDLGYALLKVGRSADALLNLATAYQLEGGGVLARNNYIVALLLEGEPEKAARIAAKAHLNQKTMEHLQQRAAKLARHGGYAMSTPVGSEPAATIPSVGIGGG